MPLFFGKTLASTDICRRKGADSGLRPSAVRLPRGSRSYFENILQLRSTMEYEKRGGSEHPNRSVSSQRRLAIQAIWLEDELRKRRRCSRCHKFEAESSQYLRWMEGDEPAFGFDGRGQ